MGPHEARPLLEVQQLGKSFGALRVVDGVTFSLAAGEALGIIGPNGAGKTTLFHLIAGNLRADAGRLVFAGTPMAALSPASRCALGIGRTHQVPHPFDGLTVFENVLVGATFGARLPPAQAERHALDTLRSTGLLPQINRLAGSLTLLDRKRLELARALATSPRLLLLDEIAGGLTEHEVRSLINLVRDIRAQGIALIWIEHIVHALMAVVDRLMVLCDGRVLVQGEPVAVMAGSEVRETYMGMEAEP